MVSIVVKKGLKIPLTGQPISEKIVDLSMPDILALDLDPFFSTKFNFLAKPGDFVKIGDVIAQDKDQEDMVFVSPASGKIREIRRGEKRRPLKVVIEAEDQDYKEFDPPSLEKKEALMSFLASSGFLTHIKKRPCNTYPDSKKFPEAIFIKAVETAPFVPPAEMQVIGFENLFEKGLEVLASLSDKVHLVHDKNTACQTFSKASFVKTHQVNNLFPACSSSLHIYHIYPIMNPSQVVWVLDVVDVITLGRLFLEGKYHISKVISRCGELLPEKERRYLRAFRGYPLGYLLSEDLEEKNIRILSGNPLSGEFSDLQGFLGFFDYSISLVKENVKRELFHFLGLGLNKFSATKAYLSGFFNKRKKPYLFSTNQHGEERAFVESDLYQRVMPMDIPVMDLIKAIMTEDFDKAVEFGLLEISPEDFILPTFVCPSKIEMYHIVKEGLDKYAKQYLAN